MAREELKFVKADYVPKDGEVVRVDVRTGKRYVETEYTPAELEEQLQKAARGIGREPAMLGVRTRGMDQATKDVVRKAVQNAGDLGKQTFGNLIVER